MDRARAALGPISPEQARKACRAQTVENEIIVCAPDEGEQWRVKGETEVDQTSRQATRTGVPRAPKLDGEACDTNLITCVGFGRNREPMILIDLAAIPDTPKGSDAEKVANGEMSDR